MINSLILLYVTLTAMVDGLGLDEEELDFDEDAGAAETIGASNTGDDGAAGDDVIVTGSGLATLSESELLAGEEETSHISFCDPPAISTPEPMEVATLPQPTETRKPVHYNTSWALVILEYRRFFRELKVF